MSTAVMEQMILAGNEAVARGAHEAGVGLAAGYPGTPATEILEALARYPGADVREVLPDVKLGLTYPLPVGRVRAFVAGRPTFVVEESEPFLEDALRGGDRGAGQAVLSPGR